jgi:hypothetical protein
MDASFTPSVMYSSLLGTNDQVELFDVVGEVVVREEADK